MPQKWIALTKANDYSFAELIEAVVASYRGGATVEVSRDAIDDAPGLAPTGVAARVAAIEKAVGVAPEKDERRQTWLFRAED